MLRKALALKMFKALENIKSKVKSCLKGCQANRTSSQATPVDDWLFRPSMRMAVPKREGPGIRFQTHPKTLHLLYSSSVLQLEQSFHAEAESRFQLAKEALAQAEKQCALDAVLGGLWGFQLQSCSARYRYL